MSANNFVLLKEYREKPFFRVSDQSIEMPPIEENYFGSADTLRGAIEIANQYIREESVEYGLAVKLLD